METRPGLAEVVADCASCCTKSGRQMETRGRLLSVLWTSLRCSAFGAVGVSSAQKKHLRKLYVHGSLFGALQAILRHLGGHKHEEA